MDYCGLAKSQRVDENSMAHIPVEDSPTFVQSGS